MNQLKKDEIIVVGAPIDAKNDSPKKPPYLKLIADCWENIFEYLSFNDILSMGQTCKRMNQMAGFYIHEYHPQLKFQPYDGDIRYKYSTSLRLKTDFHRFISVMNITHVADFASILGVETFDSLKTLIFTTGTGSLIGESIGRMRNVLKNVENIELNFCRINGNVFEQFAMHCPKLKSLEVKRCIVAAGDDPLFVQKFPALRRLRYQQSLEHPNRQINVLKIFLENHLNLGHFEIDFRLLWTNRELIQQTNVQLNFLNVFFGTGSISTPFDQVVDFLKLIYDRGFYKTMQLSMVWDIAANIEYFGSAMTMVPAMEKISLNDDSYIDLIQLTNLKKLRILNFTSAAQAQLVAKSLIKLEVLELLAMDDKDAIRSFIRYSERLKIIKVAYLRNDNIFNLLALNRERKKLENACKVTLCVPEKGYLAIQWKMQNLNLDLVKIARLDSADFNN